MTGYGKAEGVLAGGKLTVEIRTLNGKSADVAIKSNLLPKELEMSLRRRIAEVLVRGTIDVFLSFEPSSQEGRLPLDTELLKEYYKKVSALGEELQVIDSCIEGHTFTEKNAPVRYLGQSLQLLADADVAAFGTGWENARGCRIEHRVCESYGIDFVEIYSER